MTDNINTKNEYYLLAKYIILNPSKSYNRPKSTTTMIYSGFVNGSKKIFDMIFRALVRNKENFLDGNNRIDLTKIGISQEKFLKRNPNKIDDNRYINPQYSSMILEHVANYENKELQKANITKEEEFKEAHEEEEYNNLAKKPLVLNPSEIIPLSSYNMESFVINKTIDIDMFHAFNELIPLQHEITKEKNIQRVRIRIIQVLDTFKEFPINYEARCHGADGACRNKAVFTEFNKASQLRCTFDPIERDNGTIGSHVINKDGAVIGDRINLYPHIIEVETEDGKYQRFGKNLYFEEIIKPGRYDCELITHITKKDSWYIGLSVEKVQDFPRTKNNIFYPIKGNYVTENIINCLKKYYKKEKSLELMDKGRVIGEEMLSMVLSNLYCNVLSNFWIFGDSGSGKSFWEDIISHVFCPLYTSVAANEVSKHILVGGTDLDGNTVKGIFGTYNLCLFNEAGEEINKPSEKKIIMNLIILPVRFQ